MKHRFLLLLLSVGLIFTACDKEDESMKSSARFINDDPTGALKIVENGTTTTPLIAGQSQVVGSVTVWNDGEYLHVKYTTEGGACITETHLHIGKNEDDFPFAGNPKNRNLQIGRFSYGKYHDCVAEYTHKIDLADLDGPLPDYYIAAHAVVSGSGGEGSEALDSFAELLPVTATISLKYDEPGGLAYFPEVYISNTAFLNGTYLGWCIETPVGIGEQPTEYNGTIYSSYNLPDGIIHKNQGNIFQVNWILNQGFVGSPSISGGDFTYVEVQIAIWALISDLDNPVVPLPAYNEDMVNEILGLAKAYEDEFGPFRPKCGEVFALIIKIEGAQDLIIEYPVPCKYEGEETAWARGKLFNEKGGNWAMWFTHKHYPY